MDEILMQFVAAKIMHANVMEIHRKNHNKSKNRNQKSPVEWGYRCFKVGKFYVGHYTLMIDSVKYN